MNASLKKVNQKVVNRDREKTQEPSFFQDAR